MIRFVEHRSGRTLADYEADPHLVSHVGSLREAARDHLLREDRVLYVVNSTEHGGGVAEMLPSQLAVLRDLGLKVRWVVIEPNDPAFFDLTKRLHNALHGGARPMVRAGEHALYEDISRRAADALAPHLKPRDVLIVHDPQPAGMGAILKRRLGVQALWRCHIGHDESTRSSTEAWEFLRPAVSKYDGCVFSVAEYVPDFLSERVSIIPPAIDPLSHKNRELNVHAVHRILRCARLVPGDDQPLHPHYREPVRRLTSRGVLEPADRSESLDLLARPVVTQVSRWDRLKGFAPLLDAFVLLKRQAADSARQDIETRRISLARLVLAGPDPSAIADDPEGQGVLRDLSERWLALDPALQRDVALLTLPMDSRENNALIVNALQRCSSVVVQNSLREGFGLTATEAMLKGSSVQATRAAGLRSQITDAVHGRLVDDPEDPDEVAHTLRQLLDDPAARSMYGRNARRQAVERYVTPGQLVRWLELLGALTSGQGAPEPLRVTPAHTHCP